MTRVAGASRRGRRRRRGLGWTALAWLIALPLIIPLLVVFWGIFAPDPEAWQHLREHVLAEVVANTAWLVVGVAVGTGLLGTTLAWLVATCDFPGRRHFGWALLLPMAMPAYVMGFVLIGLLEYAGPVQSLMREWFGPDAGLPEIRSRLGVTLALVLVLYPYVYLIARNAFATQGGRALETARSLGMGPVSGFFRVALPLARPWIAAGIMLSVMETLADFGTVAVFNYETFTTAIYSTWYGMFSLEGAMKLSSVLVFFVFIVLVLEQLSRRRARFTGFSGTPPSRFRLRGWKAGAATGLCVFVLLLGFAIPAGQLMLWAIGELAEVDGRYFGFAGRSLGLAAMAAVTALILALLLSYAARRAPALLTQLGARVATLGYAIPGPVLAVGIFVPLAGLGGLLQGAADRLWGEDAIEIVLHGTLFALLAAYIARFLAVAYGPVNANLLRVPHSLDDAARGMGVGMFGLMSRIHLPLVRGGLLTGAILVFVDVMKEMPITLMMRPFGWDTLAIRIYEMTAEGHWERAAVPAVVLVLVGLIPVILLTLRLEREGQGVRGRAEEMPHAA